MAKKTKSTKKPAKAEVIKEVVEIPEITNEPNEDVSALNIPLIEVPKEDLQKLEPDTLDKFELISSEKKGKKAKVYDSDDEKPTNDVWVKDVELVKQIKGCQHTLGGTLYLGELRNP